MVQVSQVLGLQNLLNNINVQLTANKYLVKKRAKSDVNTILSDETFK